MHSGALIPHPFLHNTSLIDAEVLYEREARIGLGQEKLALV